MDNKPTIAVKTASIGNHPPQSRFFSLRPDIKPHFHQPLSDGRTQFYCGTCMGYVKLA